ncbi:MAG: AAA family ATPase [Gaiellaceae bacterium]|jgi:DNA-binding CsgD family transcriptional regulator
MAAPELLGRTAELAALEHLLDRARAAPAGLFFEGEAGIGKTMLWQEGVMLARQRGFRVLSCEPAPTETPLAYAGLGDLLDELPLEALRRLPSPQRNALEVSLLLKEPNGSAINQHAVALAVLALIRTITAKKPLLIAIDDVQWLDNSSARVLAFALRRIHEGPIGLLATHRSDENPKGGPLLGLDRDDELARATEIHNVGPLSLGAIRRLVTQRTGNRASRTLLAQLYRATGGNPFYALELARSDIWRTPLIPGQPIIVPEPLRALVSDRLSALPAATRETLLIASALSEPTVESVRQAGGGDLSKAVANGVIELDGERIRFTHSLFASVLYAQAPAKRRREVHELLATVAPSAEERARHLALGNDNPNEQVASELEEAARRADARGAPDAAAELYESAVRLTPPGLSDDLHRRRIKAVEHYYAVGDLGHARSLAEAILADLSEGPERADVLVLLAEMMEDIRSAVSLCHEAIEAAAGDDARLAAAYIQLAVMSVRLGNFKEHVAAQMQALVYAERAGEASTLVTALQGVGNVTVQCGEPVDERVMQRALEIDKQVTDLTTFHRPTFWLGVQLYATDQLDRAHELLTEALERATQQGEVVDRLHILSALIEVEMRLGNWDLAERLTDESLAEALDIGQEFLVHSITFHRLHLSVLRGHAEESQPGIAHLIEQAERANDRWLTLSLMSLSGFLSLSTGNAREAWRWLEPALSLQDKLGRELTHGKIPLFTIRPNAIETLVVLDEVDRAERLLESFEAHVAKTKRPNGIVSAARSRALVAAARGDLEAADRALAKALAGHEQLPDPFERGRTMLVLGTVERRAKRRRGARDAFEQATVIFDDLEARLWANKAQVELERVVGHRGGRLELTPTELQIAELVAEGRANKEIAAQLFMSVRTVETNLSNIYRRLGLQTRAELTTRFSSPDSEHALE